MAAGFMQPFGPNDFLYQLHGRFNHFNFSNRDPDFPGHFSDLLMALAPDIVHFHHYTNFGVEAFMIVKRVLPDAKVVLTLHEYLAICNNHGQMIKTGGTRLCSEETPLACSVCFAQYSPQDFFLRKRYIKFFFEKVDLFLAPSHFLAERYIAWGIDSGRIAVVDNVPAVASNTQSGQELLYWKSRSTSSPQSGVVDSAITIGFFGQMSPLKGIQVLLDAAEHLSRASEKRIKLEIYGDYSNQPLEFQEIVKSGLSLAGSEVRYHGPYNNSDVQRLMKSVDAVVVPSIWWENAPVVIEEALAARRPVICSNIGGMAEKVRDGIDGLWFDVADGQSLAGLLRYISTDPKLLQNLMMTARTPVSTEAAVIAHLVAYESLYTSYEGGSFD